MKFEKAIRNYKVIVSLIITMLALSLSVYAITDKSSYLGNDDFPVATMSNASASNALFKLANIVSVSDKDTFEEAIEAMEASGSVYIILENNIQLDSSIEIPDGSLIIQAVADDMEIQSALSKRHFIIKNGQKVDIILDGVFLTGSADSNLSGNSIGGGITVGANSELKISGNKESIRESGIKDCSWTGEGGAVYGGKNSTLVIENLTLSNNSSATGGGALFADQCKTLTITDCKIENNQGGEDFGGGGLSLLQTTTVITESTFNNNKSSSNLYGGGAITNHGSSLTINNSTIEDNKAPLGGGIFIRNYSTNAQLKATNVKILSNQATGTRGGGGIHSYSATLGITLTNVTVYNNDGGEGDGGGMYAHASSNISIVNSIFENNKGRNGAGAFTYDCTSVTMTHSEFTSNEATANGGGIHTTTVISASSSKFIGNKAANGGAVFKASEKILLFNMCTLTDNIATDIGGGAVGMNSHLWSTMTMGGCTLKNNEAPLFNDEPLSPDLQKIHDETIFYKTTWSDGYPHAYNNADIWNTGISVSLQYDENVPDGEVGTVSGMPPVDTDYAKGAYALLPITIPILEGYTFLGWSTTPQRTEPFYEISRTAQSAEEQGLYHQVTENTILYAIWSREDVSITFEIGGGSFATISGKNITYPITYETSLDDNDIDFPEESERFGYRFLGWYTKNGGEDEEYPTELTYDVISEKWGEKWDSSEEISKNIVLYARWQQWVFYVKDESQIREALSSQRKIINIKLMKDIYLTDAMRVSAVHEDREFTVNISKYDSISEDEAKIIQKGDDRHFYILSDLKVNFNLNHVLLTSESGYGGMEIETGTLTLNGNGTSSITDMSKHANGGAIYIHNGGELNLSKITLEDNKATHAGGAIAISEGGKITAENLKIINNSAYIGGGIYIGKNGNVDISDSDIISNTALDTGGGIYIADISSDVLFKDTCLEENHANENGGGIGFGYKYEKGIEILKKLKDSNFIFNENTANEYVNKLSDDEQTLYGYVQSTGSASHSLGNGIILYSETKPVDNYSVMYPGNIYKITYYGTQNQEGIYIDKNRYGDDSEVNLENNIASVYDDNAYFDGWVMDLDGNTIKFDGKLEKSANLPTDINLYAEWKYIYHTVTFDAKEGIFNPDAASLYLDMGIDAVLSVDYKKLSLEIRNGDYLPLLAEPDNKQSIDKQYFDIWEDKSFLDSPIYSNLNFTASYRAMASGNGLVIVNTAGGHPFIDSFEVLANKKIIEVLDKKDLFESIKYEGHDLIGWINTEKNVEWILNQDEVGDGEIVYLHANWEKKTINVKVKNSDELSSVIINNQIVSDLENNGFLYGDTINVNIIPKEGYYLQYIILESDSDIVYLQNNFSWLVKEDITITPIFQKNKYTVKFYEEDKITLLKTTAVIHGESIKEWEIPPEPEGYKQKWQDINGTDVNFNSIKEDKEFYRILKKESHLVEFYVNKENEIYTHYKSYNIDFGNSLKEINDLVSPEKNYYEFKGWSTSENIPLLWNLDNDIITHDMKLYSAWNLKDAPEPLIESAAVNGEPINIDNPEPITIVAGNIAYFDIKTNVTEEEPVNSSRNEITYQWYKADANGNPLNLIAKTSSGQYGFSFSTPGKDYYIVKVINNNPFYSGQKEAYIYSKMLTIEVESAPLEAAVPVVYTNPESIRVKVGEEASLEVEAISIDNGKLSYQWFDLETNIAIDGATSEKFYASTEETGIDRYYVEIYNTIIIPTGMESTSSVKSNGAIVDIWDDQIPQVYVVTYHANGGTSGNIPVDTNRYNDGDEVAIFGNASLRRSGYTFLGWSLRINDINALLYEGDIIIIDGDNIDLYAQWRRNNTSGGSGGGSDSGSTKPAETVPPITDSSGETTEAAENGTSTQIIPPPPGIELPDQEIIVPEGPKYSVAEYPGYSFVYDEETGKYIVINQEGIPLGYLNQLPVSIPKTNDTSMFTLAFILFIGSSFVIYISISKKYLLKNNKL